MSGAHSGGMERCRHDLPLGSCVTCRDGLRTPEELLNEVIDERTTTCSLKTCGAEIVWTTTERGRAMPVDLDPTNGGDVEVYLEGGELHSRVVRGATPGDYLRTSHFATCPGAGAFRKRGSRR